MTRPQGMYVGELVDPAAHERSGEAVGLNPDDLTTHGVIVGMTGSGKTGLGVTLVEEALGQGVATLVLDPKGDMGNLLLGFPDLSPTDFAPWVPPDQDAATVAGSWASGLGDWGLSGADIRALHDGRRFTVFTPGSSAGVPLNIFGSLAPPTGVDAETVHDEAESLVQGLLGLIGVNSDPLSGREHVLMANIIETAWAAGETLDMTGLLLRIQDPPMRKLGVVDIEQFFPAADRTALMMKFNGLLASPSFAAWGQGAPLDIGSMLWDSQGRPGCAVVYLAHLSDEARQLVVTRVLSKLVGWMRSQQGSTKLRVLVYMDEVYGYVPPTAAPPSKKPILTLFKQARAFGVGVVLSTQNPVDLDYKAISNAGTWLIGRLQTDRDKQRLLEGMTSAAGTVDVAATDATISGLAKREFLLHTTGGKPPRVFGVRWCMSYLAGPLAKEQVGRLPGMAEQMGPAVGSTAAPPAPTGVAEPGAPDATAPLPAGGGAEPVPTTPPAAALGHDESPAMPKVAAGVRTAFADPAAPWATQLGAGDGGRRLEAAVVVRCSLAFSDARAGVREVRPWAGVLYPLASVADVEGLTPIGLADGHLRDTAPAGAVYVLPSAPVGTSAYFTKLQSLVKEHLARNERIELLRNPGLKLVSRPEETAEEFALRCRQAADAAAAEQTETAQRRADTKRTRLEQAIDDAAQRAQQAQEQQRASAAQEMVSGAGSLLGALFGKRKSVSSITGAVNRAATGRSRSARAGQRVDTAVSRVEQKRAELQALEDSVADEVAAIADKWARTAETIEPAPVTLARTDVGIDNLALVWLPTP